MSVITRLQCTNSYKINNNKMYLYVETKFCFTLYAKECHGLAVHI